MNLNNFLVCVFTRPKRLLLFQFLTILFQSYKQAGWNFPLTFKLTQGLSLTTFEQPVRWLKNKSGQLNQTRIQIGLSSTYIGFSWSRNFNVFIMEMPS